MKKFSVIISFAVLALGALSFNIQTARAANPAPQVATLDVAAAPTDQPAAQFANLDVSAPATPVAQAVEAPKVFAAKPDAAFALLALAVSLLAVIALARGVRGAERLKLPQLLRLAAGISLNALDRMFAMVFPRWRDSRAMGVDAWTKIADLWVPEVLMEGLSEPVVQNTSFLDNICVTSTELATIAAQRGNKVRIPFIVDPNHDDEVQQEDTAPAMQKLGSLEQDAAVFNRVSTLGATALSGIVSGVAPGGDILSVLISKIQGLRKRQRNRLVLAQYFGLFDVTSAPAANTGAFKALRYDAFSETGVNPAAAQLIDSTKMLYAIAALGENAADKIVGGSIFMHSQIAAALTDQDQIDVIRNSQGEIVLRQWKGATVFVSDLLVRAGGVSGKVYYTFIAGKGACAMGDKQQVVTNMAGEVAALQLDLYNIAKNNVAVYDRTRFVCHPQGASWTPGNGVPAAVGGPSNTELGAAANWTLALNDVKNCNVVCIRTNG